MSLPEPILDDLRFQKDIVDEARLRIVDYCPEWTNYNVSDPGIALLELFAWMTELITFRLNQVPEKNYIRFLDMLGVQLRPPVQAKAELTFWLSGALPFGPDDHTRVIVPKATEVATWPADETADDAAEVVFSTDETFVILPPKLKELRRKPKDDVTGEIFLEKNYLPRLATEDRSSLEDFNAFDEQNPQLGDTFYLGFDESHDIRGHITRLSFWCDHAKGTGVSRSNPPLVWEYFGGDGEGEWLAIKPSRRRGEKDTTGGLNNDEGQIVFYFPLTMRPCKVHGIAAYWLRCRLQPTDARRQGEYSQSPLIERVEAHTLGGTTTASQATIITEEIIGRSTGEANQRFTLQHHPVLTLEEGETVEVEITNAQGESEIETWDYVNDFSISGQHDRHFTFDYTANEVVFGPAIRQPDGNIERYGKIPKTDALIRFSRYRAGGGIKGNVQRDQLQVLKNAVPYIDRVSNLVPTKGGKDQEELEAAKMRARREIQTQNRAVTTRDFERLAKKGNAFAKRVKVQIPIEGDAGEQLKPGTLEVLVVPDVSEVLGYGDLSSLKLLPRFKRDLHHHLDEYRLIATLLEIRAPRYIGIQVHAEIISMGQDEGIALEKRAIRSLEKFLSPVPMHEEDDTLDAFLGEEWEGWPFGQNLYLGEIFSLLQQVPGIRYVKDIRVSYRDVVPEEEVTPNFPELDPLAGDDPLDLLETGPALPAATLTAIPSTQRVLEIPGDTLFCSLEHIITVVKA
ncbi:MAG: putative baseplate assembly protein [Chloroflexota bacterium]